MRLNNIRALRRIESECECGSAVSVGVFTAETPIHQDGGGAESFLVKTPSCSRMFGKLTERVDV